MKSRQDGSGSSTGEVEAGRVESDLPVGAGQSTGGWNALAGQISRRQGRKGAEHGSEVLAWEMW